MTIAASEVKSLGMTATLNTAQPAILDAGISFETAMEELGNIVRQLEAGQVPLSEAIGLYEKATLLKAHCNSCLRDAEMRIERIQVESGDASPSVTPFEGG